MKQISLKDVVISSLTIIISICYFSAHCVDEDLMTIDLYFFEIGTFGFPAIIDLLYYAKMKILLIMFAIFWYLSCKHWWRNIILLTISIEITKLVGALNKKEEYMDLIDLKISLTIAITIVIIIYFLSKKLKVYNKYLEFKNDIDLEIDNLLFDLDTDINSDVIRMKKEFLYIKSQKNKISSEEYLQKLQQLKSEFYA